MKPNFLIIGAAKCGSTTITSMLGMHRDVYTVPDEVGFFALDEIYKRGISWYESLFSHAEGVKCIGENSNHYTMKENFPCVLDRILNYFDPSDLKLIYSVRHPFEMIESFWIESRSHGGESMHYDFNTAVSRNMRHVVNTANYWSQIEPYRKYFSDEQIHIVFLEDLKNDQAKVIGECYDFLGVNPLPALELPNKRLNASESKKVVTPLKSRLREIKGYKKIVSLLPRSVKEILTEKLLMQKVKSRPKWNREVRDWVAQELAEDTRTFLNYCGKPEQFWQLKTSVE